MTRTILKSLLKPSAYPEPTTTISLVQTHVSFIFITDHFVYKIKKPVDFGFLNFKTIDRRRFYCNEEVRLNRRLCPDMYLGVIELRKSSDVIAFHGNGEIIDYAVKMRRLPKDRMLDQLVANNNVGETELRNVAKTIARFHHETPTSESVAEYGSIEKISANWHENFIQMERFTTILSDNDRLYMQNFVEKYISMNKNIFMERMEQGCIRECNGDIHLENICIEDKKVHIFDCIEFNDRFRFCDTAADIAFLYMDLEYNRRKDLAEIIIDEYLKESNDKSLLAVIHFYTIYRAFVRGKVDSFQLDDINISDKQKNDAAERAIRYFRLAKGYMERLKMVQTLFITTGLMGSGKSSLAEELSFALGIPVYNSDMVRKQLNGISNTTKVTVPFGEDIYSKDKTQRVYQELFSLARLGIKKGTSIIIDASFPDAQLRANAGEIATQFGIPIVILHTSCKPSELKRRLQNRALLPSVSDGRIELLKHHQAIYEPPEEKEGMVINLDSKQPVDKLLERIYQQMGQKC